MMKKQTQIILACFALTACNGIEGTFEPACVAYEGDRVVVTGSRFEWRKFTDERLVDDDGNVIDPFPGYPVTGRYKIKDSVVEFTTAEGTRLDDMHLFDHDGGVFLLTREQNSAVLAGDGLPACALRLNAGNFLN